MNIQAIIRFKLYSNWNIGGIHLDTAGYIHLGGGPKPTNTVLLSSISFIVTIFVTMRYIHVWIWVYTCYAMVALCIYKTSSIHSLIRLHPSSRCSSVAHVSLHRRREDMERKKFDERTDVSMFERSFIKKNTVWWWWRHRHRHRYRHHQPVIEK